MISKAEQKVQRLVKARDAVEAMHRTGHGRVQKEAEKYKEAEEAVKMVGEEMVQMVTPA